MKVSVGIKLLPAAPRTSAGKSATPAIAALGSWRQECPELRASLSYVVTVEFEACLGYMRLYQDNTNKIPKSKRAAWKGRLRWLPDLGGTRKMNDPKPSFSSNTGSHQVVQAGLGLLILLPLLP